MYTGVLQKKTAKYYFNDVVEQISNHKPQPIKRHNWTENLKIWS